MKKNTMTYSGFYEDTHGMTTLGRVVLDGWLFGFIPESEDCKGWDMARMQVLMNRVEAAWDEHGNLPSRLPPELRGDTLSFTHAPQSALRGAAGTRNSAMMIKHRLSL